MLFHFFFPTLSTVIQNSNQLITQTEIERQNRNNRLDFRAFFDPNAPRLQTCVFQKLLRESSDINNRNDIELLMTEALLSPEKLPFAKLFLELGFGMNKFLTPGRLSQLYASSYKNCLYFRDVCNWIKGGGVQQVITINFSETVTKVFPFQSSLPL